MVQGMPPFRHSRFSFHHSLRKQGIQKDNQSSMARALRLFLKRGDDGEWAMVKMVRGKHPFRHSRFSFRHSLRKQGIQKYNQSSMARALQR